MTLETETWEISSTGVNHLFDSNHEEADSRLMHHCILDNRPVVDIATDSDILICMIYAFSLLLPDHDWFIQTSPEKLVNISKIHDHFGREICLIIPSFFILTGCDTVSFFFRKTKKAVFQRVLKIPDLAVTLLTDLGNERDVSVSCDEKIKNSFQVFVYGGKDTEELIDTRITNYDRFNIKTTQYILPDLPSLTQHVRRADLQCYY